MQEKHWLEAVHLHRLYVRSARTKLRLAMEANESQDHLQLSLRRVFTGHPSDVLGNSFDQCYHSRPCSELVLRTIAITHLTDCDGDHVLTCKDVALLHQLGVAGCGALRAHALGRRARIGARRPLRLLHSAPDENHRVMFALEYLRVLSTHRCISQPLYDSDNRTWQSIANDLSKTSKNPTNQSAWSSTLSPLDTSESSTVSIVSDDTITLNSNIKNTFQPETTMSSPATTSSFTNLNPAALHRPAITHSSTTDNPSSVAEAPVHISTACFRCIRSASSNNSEPICAHPLQKCGQYAITFRYYLDANGERLIRNHFPQLISSENESNQINRTTVEPVNIPNGEEDAILQAWLVWMRKQQELGLSNSEVESNNERDNEKFNLDESLSKLLPKLEAKDISDMRGFSDEIQDPELHRVVSETSELMNEDQPILIRRNSRAFTEKEQEKSQQLGHLSSRHRQPRSAVYDEKEDKAEEEEEEEERGSRQNSNEIFKLVRRQRRSKLLQGQDSSLLAPIAKQLLQETEQLDRRISSLRSTVNSGEQADALARAVIRSQAFARYQRCVQNDRCAEQLVNEYVNRHMIDCNLDRVIDCDDFAGIHWFGRDCRQTTLLYSNFWKNFEYCSILADDVRRKLMLINYKL